MVAHSGMIFRSIILLILLAFGSSARAEWWEATTSHFIVVSESSSADAEQFARKLERFDNALRFLQGMPVPGPDVGDANRVKVYRFGDTDDIAYLAGSRGSGVAGFYIPRAGSPVAFVPAREKREFSKTAPDNRPTLDTQTVLFHEYTHHFMLANFSATYPHWYVEGFAELYATIALNDDGSYHVGNVPQHRGEGLRELPDPRLTRLFDHTVKLTGLEQYQSYTVGWLLSHYLSFNEKRKGQLASYLKALNTGEDSLTAAQRVFGDISQLQKEVRAYKKGPFPGYDVKIGGYVAPSVTMRRLPAAEEALMRNHIRSKRGVSVKEAKDVARDVGGKDVIYADSLAAQLIVGEAYLDNKNYDKAEATLARAIALDPNSSEAQFMMAAVYLARAEDDKAMYAKARPYLARAIKLDGKDPRPVIAYYMSYYEAKDPIPESALIALEGIYKIASYDGTYRLLLGRQLLDENKGDIARSVLAPLAFSAHRGDEENKVATIIEQIDAAKLDEARTTMAAIFQKAKDDRDGNSIQRVGARPAPR